MGNLCDQYRTWRFRTDGIFLSMNVPLVRRSSFVTFDGSVALTTDHQRPDRYRHLEIDFGRKPRIARGGGYSYAAASFGKGVLVQELGAFDRILAFGPGPRVRVEAGITLAKLVEFAHARQTSFPVLPGYPYITVGGCIAADVHGKNPERDGTFCDWVEALTLYHPGKGFATLNRATTPDLFEATCGGIGLTGLIVDATLRLQPLPALSVLVERAPVRSLAEAADAIAIKVDHDFAYSWHDGSMRGSSFGRGILFSGSWRVDPELPRPRPYRIMRADERALLPFSIWTRSTVRIASAAFRLVSALRTKQVEHVANAAFPLARQTLYHRLYGRRGLAEAQLLVPEQAFSAFETAVAGLVQRCDPTLVFLSVKRFRGQQKACSLTGSGILVALDLARNGKSEKFLDELDAITLDLGAQPNVLKDSRLSSRVAARTLPHYCAFGRSLARHDADRLYQSETSRRLGL
jgi:decaprenylphospho-beta-D-ribofuranose 2-oxidase